MIVLTFYVLLSVGKSGGLYDRDGYVVCVLTAFVVGENNCIGRVG